MSENKYTAMTVNERLFVSNLLDEFDQAVSRKNVNRVKSILKQVELTEESIGPILKQLGLEGNITNE